MLLPGSVSPSANTVRATRTQVASQIGVTLFLLFLIPGVGLMIYLQSPIPLIGFLLAGLYLLFAVKVAQQWEKAAVLRLGEYRGLRGPGLFLIIPVIDSVSEFIDQRIIRALNEIILVLYADNRRDRARLRDLAGGHVA